MWVLNRLEFDIIYTRGRVRNKPPVEISYIEAKRWNWFKVAAKPLFRYELEVDDNMQNKNVSAMIYTNKGKWHIVKIVKTNI